MKSSKNQLSDKLWKLVESIQKKQSRTEILANLYQNLTVRSLQKDIKHLKSLGLDISHSRKTDLYKIEFPEKTINLDLTPKEFFQLFLAVKESAQENNFDLPSANKVQQALYNERDHIIDLSQSYLANGLVSETIKPVFEELRSAIRHQRTALFNYLSKTTSIRQVNPYRLVQTPHSFFMIGFDLQREDYRTFKLTRISNLILSKESFEFKDFDFDSYRGDAFYLRKGKEQHEVQVLFHGEAAQSIREYQLHPSQSFTQKREGTLVTWQISELSELSSWLCQWLGSFTIVKPQELKNEINKRLDKHKMLNKASP